jgi:uncharacterized protein (DUF427 family)
MKAIWQDTVIAESDDTVVVEGNHYFPRDAIVSRYFLESDHDSFCPWKGTARYYTLEIDGNTNENAAWYYPDPKPDASMLSDRIAFWRGVQVVE